jgi:hypothetical protein
MLESLKSPRDISSYMYLTQGLTLEEIMNIKNIDSINIVRSETSLTVKEIVEIAKQSWN